MAEKKIGGETFKVDQMLAWDALVLQARLLRVVGPAASKLPAILSSRREGATDAEKASADVEALGAITDIFARCNPDEIADLVKTVVEIARIKRPSGNYEPVDMDGDFTGKLGNIIPMVIFVLKEQFGDFFSGALVSGTRAIKAAG